ncbi:triose-phosphate isomerase [Thermoflexus sp.]|uniref:triose-phosphate isomerase n=1 Tax=Thermoflexus sp. TaxID=1969742 RepID=UPI0025E8AE70|nr:triose-phosphate isomerase [Thermoflexus sp.]MCS6962560.1 triose-phosphate isomerase [Thermoflexus sp.]MCX7690102.1 triose-phosphate isomerase [Thermoflexus sp.]MDW8181629.1 triose-phosphate isomerase [Anaerolineae bacterium]MDW8184683.1 triose-phosphate isomerase [Anaerolineae bacterium]
MRQPLIAGNWKMNKTATEGQALARAIREGLQTHIVEVVLCPPFPVIPAVHAALQGSSIRLGAQNVHWEDAGAFTGEVSPVMLKEWCQYVIIGHSERRQYFHEDDEMIRRKVLAALRHGLIPILCVGETLAQREAGETGTVVAAQTRRALEGLTPDQAASLVIAYEPVWAIGTGRAATGTDAEEVIQRWVRGTLEALFGPEVAQQVRVLYGGSVTPENIAEFVCRPTIDGALVGGASLKAETFLGIIHETARAKA